MCAHKAPLDTQDMDKQKCWVTHLQLQEEGVNSAIMTNASS